MEEERTRVLFPLRCGRGKISALAHEKCELCAEDQIFLDLFDGSAWAISYRITATIWTTMCYVSLGLM